MTIIIHEADVGEWCIEDRSSEMGGADFLACYDTKRKAISKARSKWAAPGQPIRVAGLNPEVVREGDPDWKRQNSGAGGIFDLF